MNVPEGNASGSEGGACDCGIIDSPAMEAKRSRQSAVIVAGVLFWSAALLSLAVILLSPIIVAGMLMQACLRALWRGYKRAVRVYRIE